VRVPRGLTDPLVKVGFDEFLYEQEQDRHDQMAREEEFIFQGFYPYELYVDPFYFLVDDFFVDEEYLF
jgi:hypothetical protein